MMQSATGRYACLVLGTLLLAGCASNKPPADQVFLMPAPAVYGEGHIDPFGGSALPADSPLPCILYATDRAPTKEPEHFAYYSDERANLLRLGEACIEPAGDQALTWAELRRISLLKDRSDRYPLQVGSVDEYGILERSVPPFAGGVERSPLPGERFAAAIDARLATAANKDVYIYVHGYKVDYENPVLVAGELWNFLGNDGAFIAYSWPSTRKTLAYWSDLDDALNSARGLRMLIAFLSEHSDAENIHVIGYSAGTRLVARMLADLGMYSRFMGEDEIRRRVRLGHVILVGSDIDRGILGGYVLDGALRVPKSLTLYQSSADSALSLSKLLFRRERAGEALIGEMATEQARRFLSSHPRLRVIDVSNAEGAVSGSGHGYLRESPWVSSDVVLSLRYDLAPEERGLVRAPGSPVWTFPDDYLERAGAALDRAESASP
jgi:esterase/lipase superfamily enzyme